MQTPIWVPILAAGITAVVGTLGGQLLSGLLTNRREREQREDELKRKKEERLREERISAYSNFVKVSQSILKRLGEKRWTEYADRDREELGEAWSVIQLVGGSEDALGAAHALFDQHMSTIDWLGDTKVKNGEDIDSRYLIAIKECRQTFVWAAREDMGHPPKA